MIFHNFLCCKFCLKIIKKIIKLCSSKISTCVKYLIDAYHRYILRRYILPSCFGNLNSRACQGDSLNVMFPRFLNCFQPFPLVFPHVSPGVSTFPHSVFPVSYFRFFGCISALHKSLCKGSVKNDFVCIETSETSIHFINYVQSHWFTRSSKNIWSFSFQFQLCFYKWAAYTYFFISN